MGCGQTTGVGDAGDNISFEPPDAGPPSRVGEACEGDDACDEGGFCLTTVEGGYCSAPCDEGACVDGNVCLSFDGRLFQCLLACDLGEANPCPRPGFGCAEGLDTPVCLTGCDIDADCGEGRACDPEGGQAGRGSCSTPDAVVGDVCGEEEDCAEGQQCFGSSSLPAAICTTGCELDDEDPCPGDAVCRRPGFLAVRGFNAACFASCSEDAECTEGFGCADGACEPVFDVETLGQVCSAGRGSCEAGFCLSEFRRGWPDSYCVATGCDPDTGDGCPGDGVCVTLGGVSAPVCLDGCLTDDECRDGYACRPSGEGRSDSCQPACTSDEQCGNDSFRCNAESGFCTR
jgi:hypothetical protein